MTVTPALRYLFARSLAPIFLLLMGLCSTGFSRPAFGQTAPSAAAAAQTATIQTQGPSTWDSYSGVISASDGNFYAVSADEEYGGFTPIDFGCPDQSGNDCTFIDKITPSGTVTQMHTFETNGFGNNGGAPNTDGFGPTPLVEGSDGYLYGSTNSGGSAGYGTIFKISTAGVFTVLFTFPNKGTALDPVAPDGAYPSRLIFGADGNLYGTSQQLAGGYYLFQVTTSGSLTIIASSIVPGDPAPQSIVQGSDGSFYAVNGFAFEQITLGGSVNSLHLFVVNQSQTMQPIGSLVEGPDKNFYGTDGMSGSVFQVSPSGSLNLIYTLQPTDGRLISPELTLGSDGNFYSTTYIGGITTACPSMTQAGDGIGCGTVFQVTPTGSFTNLYSFLGVSVDGAQPDGWLLQGGAGSFYGTFFSASPPAYNDMFNLSLSPALAPPIQITFTVNGQAVSSVTPNTPISLNWSVLNAFSLTAQQCHAFVTSIAGSPLGAGDWSGPQSGSLKESVYTGKATITPTLAGVYTYVLNCGGVEIGTATLTVSGVTITTTNLHAGVVSVPYNDTVDATGGVTPYTWGSSGALPAGLSLQSTASNAAIDVTGTPTQFGKYQVGILVQDSSNPQQIGLQTFTLNIASGLALVGTLNNGNVGTAYNATVTATGGLPPYKWSLTSGKLPTGLTLNASSGVIAGTPTLPEHYTFSITVTDSEGTPATLTQSYTVSTVVSPLTIVPGDWPDCTVNVLCDGQYQATGGTPPYTWSIEPKTTFPPGLTLTTGGTFTGLPTQYDCDPPSAAFGVNRALSVQVTDSSTPPLTVTDATSLCIVSGLTIVSIPLPEATVGVFYQAPPPVATGGVPPYTWEITGSSPLVAQEFGVKPAIGALYSFSGGPITAGTFQLTYLLSDSEGMPASEIARTTLTVASAAVTSTTTLSSSNSTAGVGMPITLTAKATASGSTPSGVVTFYNGGASLGTATLNATGAASITTTFTAAGVYTLTASYAGGGAVTGSVSAPLTETVVTPTVSAAITPGSITIKPGASGTLTITVTPTGGYTGSVGFSCGMLPKDVSCTFASPSITLTAGSGAVTDTLTVNTTATQSAMLSSPLDRGQPGRAFPAMMLWLPGSLAALLGIFPRRQKRPFARRLWMLTLILLALGGIGTMSGCAGMSNDARPGTYSIPVTLTLSSGTAQTVNATVIVQ